MKSILIYGDGIIGKLSALVLSGHYKVYLISKCHINNSKYKQERFFSINLLTKFLILLICFLITISIVTIFSLLPTSFSF